MNLKAELIQPALKRFLQFQTVKPTYTGKILALWSRLDSVFFDASFGS